MRKQTRRSISISGRLYMRVRLYCEAQGISLSSLVENVVAQHLGPPPTDPAEVQEVDAPDEVRQDDGDASVENHAVAEESAKTDTHDTEKPVRFEEVSEPEVSEPEVSEPEVSEPEVSEPEVSEPEEPVVVDREPVEPRIVPRRPAADPSLQLQAEQPNPELGTYIPPHLLF